jgi:integrase
MSTVGQALSQLPTGEFLHIAKINPSGALVARKLASGAIQFYWRVTLQGKTTRHPLGFYDSGAPPKSLVATKKGFSIAAASRAAENYAHTHESNRDNGGLTGIKAGEKQAAEHKAAEELRAKEFTLSKLLDAYCGLQKERGRSSYKDARSIFELHIKQAFPLVASQPANTVSMEQFVGMMRRLHELGHGRTSNKLRSYVRAAYEVAKYAKSNAATPTKFLDFAVSHNPLADTAVDFSSNRADKNPLTTEQMRLYWNAIKDLDGLPGAVLRLHLFTGAQRIEQFVKLQSSEIGDAHILLWDGKGKPGKAPRANPVPLIPAADIALKECIPTGKYALSTDKGKTHIHATTLSKWAQAAVGDLIPGFRAKQLRSGVETLLAGKVDKEIRGRLQSHGISGVQDANYNGYDYLDEQRDALNLMFKLITEQQAAAPQ